MTIKNDNKAAEMKRRLAAALFIWREVYNPEINKTVLYANNEIGSYAIHSSDEEERHVVYYFDEVIGVEKTLEEAKELAFGALRGTIVRYMLAFRLMGIQCESYYKEGHWDVKQVDSFLADQSMGCKIADPAFQEEFVQSFEIFGADNNPSLECDCGKCQPPVDDEILPGDPDAFEEDDGSEIIYSFKGPIKPTLH